MKIRHHRRAGLLLALILSALLWTLSVQAANVPQAQPLYTQFSLFYEKKIHWTTNYRVGILVPINTEVLLVKSKKNLIVLRLPNGEKFQLYNIPQYSGENIDGIFKRTLSTTPVDLSSFSAEEQTAILTGQLHLGMSKEATLRALGYPPRHKTPSLELDQWQYWQSRFDSFIVHFEGGKVVSIQD